MAGPYLFWGFNLCCPREKIFLGQSCQYSIFTYIHKPCKQKFQRNPACPKKFQNISVRALFLSQWLHCFYHNGWYSWKLNNIIHPSARSKSDFKNNFIFSCWFWNRIVKESEIEINSLFNTSTFYLLLCAGKVNLKNKRRINQSN